MDLSEQIAQMGDRAVTASRSLNGMTTAEKNRLLEAMAEGIEEAEARILSANEADMAAASAAGRPASILDRLMLDRGRLAVITRMFRQIVCLPDPVGAVIETISRPNGLLIEKVRMPLGVIAVIYEARPNVTADAAALCFKAGNAVILRGGSEADASNRAIHDAMIDAATAAGLPAGAVQYVPTTERAAVNELLGLTGAIDLVVPRGGESLIRAVSEAAKVPVLKHFKGVCHVYVDDTANHDMASRIIINAKCQRPGVCNAMETLLVHADIAADYLPRIGRELDALGVILRADDRARVHLPDAQPATEADWFEEYLDLVLAVGVVDDLDAAVTHIERYGTLHSDVIVTGDDEAARRFCQSVRSAAVYVNASCRFTDGRMFGMGAEIGISTDKLHARGPCGLVELTTYKYVIRGTGQVREDQSS